MRTVIILLLLISSFYAASADYSTLPCSDKSTMKERISCQINLPEETIKSVGYMPEQCNALATTFSTSKLDSCISDYKLYQSCLYFTDDVQRDSCIRPKLHLGTSTSIDVSQCNAKPGAYKALCLQNLRDNTYKLALFRMNVLSYKVEKMTELGFNKEDGLNFLVILEESKIKFNSAPSLIYKQSSVDELNSKWGQFKTSATKQLMPSASS
ncbi:MAG: hypothetical protein Q7S22_06810 [Candidatus Micrarchaeota archaeon]|nr:hypothetical protein [Candidatus Micrarchaeota archaeon]